MLICGVDEAGRGPLVGAVYTAAVILDPAQPITGLADSKVLSEAKREALALEIRARALAWFIARADAAEIDRVNIFQATMATRVSSSGLYQRRLCASQPASGTPSNSRIAVVLAASRAVSHSGCRSIMATISPPWWTRWLRTPKTPARWKRCAARCWRSSSSS